MIPYAQLSNHFRGKRIFVTGHTGFKGSWLTVWLQLLGAEVCGFSKDIPTQPSLFGACFSGDSLRDERGDICNFEALNKSIKSFKPDLLFHLAAQPLVRLSYAEPVNTFATNVLGTVNVLEAIAKSESIAASVIVTTDKCYENLEWEFGYRENDRLGGSDPYSASKACAEIVFSSYERSFFNPGGHRSVTVRAGNVIGGGDWATDRIVPDLIRNWRTNTITPIRNPRALRPWQHVLDPLGGYLQVAANLLTSGKNAGESFNFGPENSERKTVGNLLGALKKVIPALKFTDAIEPNAKKEANLLFLNCDKAAVRLQWRPVLNFERTIELTGEWYRDYYDRESGARSLTEKQIQHFIETAGT